MLINETDTLQLLAPATEALTDPCLPGVYKTYPWVEGICLMSIFALFFVELMTMRYAKFDHRNGSGFHPGEHASDAHEELRSEAGRSLREINVEATCATELSHDQCDGGIHHVADSYAAQITGIFVLEFGIIFHPIFIGLTLAVSGKEFNTLYVVLVFHQTFEGLALGSRFASVKWPKESKWTPYTLGVGYALSTPLSIAIGLGVRSNYHPGGQSALITNGVFDSISAGILIYTGLVELMARDFVFSSHIQHAPITEMLSAFGTMCCGAGLMALLGKWA